MSKQIDWSKAPKRHPLWLEFKLAEQKMYSGWYRAAGEYFKGYFGAHWPKYREGQFFDVHMKKEDCLITCGYLPPLEKPSPSWSGEGLPPVGTVCRIITDDSAWWKYSGLTDGEDVTVCHSFKNSKGYDMVIVEACNGACLAVTVECVAPISTPEQIAADEREAAVNDMHAIYMKGAVHGGGLYAIYDAGYRKP